ncbi:MAG TPA: hypothetical protein VIF83_00280 [Gemmatimonadaceae bacterium]
MRTIFKGTLVVFAIAAGLTLTAVSCRDNATGPVLRAPDPIPVNNDQGVADLRAKMSWMGNFHTDVLTYIQSQLTANRQTARTKDERCRVASKAFKDFTKAYRKDGLPLALPADFESGLGCEGGAPVGTRPTVMIGAPGRLQPRHDLSQQALNYLNRIESAIDADVDLAVIISSIYAIEAEAAGTLTYAEASAIFGLGSIAVSSAEYWGANSGGWGGEGGLPMAYSIFAQPNGISTDRLSPLGKFILKADVAAAISSYVKDWWTGAASLEKALVIGAAASAIAGVSRFI